MSAGVCACAASGSFGASGAIAGGRSRRSVACAGSTRKLVSDVSSCAKANDHLKRQIPLRVALDELVPVKEAVRTLPQQIDRLEAVEQLVLTRRNQPVGVLVGVERYQQLLNDQRVPR